MKDYDEESEEDEGSLYVPSEATSELNTEVVNTYEALVKPSPLHPCMFLLLLPREIRDKVRVLRVTFYGRTHALTICFTYLDLRIRPEIGHSHVRS